MQRGGKTSLGRERTSRAAPPAPERGGFPPVKTPFYTRPMRPLPELIADRCLGLLGRRWRKQSPGQPVRLSQEAQDALRCLLAALPPGEAADLLFEPRGSDGNSHPLGEAGMALLRETSDRLPLEQAIAAFGGTRGSLSKGPWPWSPGSDSDAAAFFAEAWVHTGGYAGLLAALAGYLSIRPHLDRSDFDPDAGVLDELRRAAVGGEVVGAGAARRLVSRALLDADQRLHLVGARLRVPDAPAAWILLHELLVRDSYAFEPAPERAQNPRVLDGGAHVGLGVYAVLRSHPGARITCFEPSPGNRRQLEENLVKNQWSGVEVLPYALAAENGEARFTELHAESMAGSLTRRLADHPSARPAEAVPTRRLGPWLEEPVDFLKLDIEGPEAEVLADAAGPDGRGLDTVANVFVEYHHGRGLAADRLPQLLQTLTVAGFDLQLNKSFTAEVGAATAPLLHGQRAYALDVHGTRAPLQVSTAGDAAPAANATPEPA